MVKIICVFFAIYLITNLNYTRTYYDNGQLRSEGWILNKKKTNYWKFYYSKGGMKAKGHFKDGIKAKYWYYYDHDGNKAREGNYKNGLREGWWKYYKNDTIIDIQFKQDKRNALSIFRVNGKAVKAEYYKDDRTKKVWHTFEKFRKEYPQINE